MRARFAVLVVALFVALGWGIRLTHARQAAPGKPNDASEAIKAVLSTQQAAWNRGDIPTFLEGYWNSPDLTFSGSNGIVRGYGGVLERYQKAYPDKDSMGELEFSGLEIRMLGPDSALVLGHWHLIHKNGDAGGVFTLIFRRLPAGWRIIHDHTSAQKLTP
jgi:uncharacterized protein (TIGR02246 family)